MDLSSTLTIATRFSQRTVFPLMSETWSVHPSREGSSKNLITLPVPVPVYTYMAEYRWKLKFRITKNYEKQ